MPPSPRVTTGPVAQLTEARAYRVIHGPDGWPAPRRVTAPGRHGLREARGSPIISIVACLQIAELKCADYLFCACSTGGVERADLVVNEQIVLLAARAPESQ